MNPRYSRQTILSEIGETGQQKLRRATIAIVGCGGLGAIAAAYLAGAGIGNLILIDGDQIDISNLHRQVFYKTNSKAYKCQDLAKHIADLNPDTKVKIFNAFLTKENSTDFLKFADYVLDCTDRIETKFLINDWCVINKVPLIFAAVYKFEGYASTFLNNNSDGFQLRDFYTDDKTHIPNCSEVGVFNTIVGIFGLLQANEVMKLILGIGRPLVGKLYWFDALENDHRTIKLKKSFDGNMEDIWVNENYIIPEFCANLNEEITKSELSDLKNPLIISILEKRDHIDLFENIIHMPRSRFNVNGIEDFDEQRAIIFYCRSGIQSLQLVQLLKQEYPERQFFSLKGGLKSNN